jgi:predicted nuclease of predicted toxin-antitoxin system
LKFKVDENLPVECALYLQAAGHDAETVTSEALSGSEDHVLFDHCKREERILITLDLDFANVQMYPPRTHAGVVVLRPPNQDKPTLLSVVRRLSAILASRSPKGQLWIVEADRVRVREQ